MLQENRLFTTLIGHYVLSEDPRETSEKSWSCFSYLFTMLCLEEVYKQDIEAT